MSAQDLVGLGIIVSYAIMMGVEAAFPARAYPTRTLWRVRGWGFLVLMALVGTFVPLMLPTQWLSEHRLIDGTGLGLVGGALVGWTVVSFVNYLWHRATHTSNLLWRAFHQMHHAPQRLDLGGAAVFHPLDVSTYVAINTVVTTLILGLTPEASALVGFIAQFYAFFQHMNVRTPQWVGYFIQRPEGHFVHHAREVHAFNYGDLPIWDILLGTFRNPAAFGAGGVGFDAPADSAYGRMLGLQDVSESVGTKGAPQLQQTA